MGHWKEHLVDCVQVCNKKILLNRVSKADILGQNSQIKNVFYNITLGAFYYQSKVQRII